MLLKAEITARLAEIRSTTNDLFAEVANLDARADTLDAAGYQERRGGLGRAVTKLEEEERDLRAQLADIETREGDVLAALGAGRSEAGDGANSGQRHQRARQSASPTQEARDNALKVLERNADAVDSGRGDELDAFVRSDRSGVDARYLAAVGDPAYDAAFGLLLADPTTGHLRMTAKQVEAVRAVGQAQQERAMAEGVGSAGGFGVPFQLDPSIILSSAGALNPLRQIASVKTIQSSQWRGVSSAGVTAAFSAEGVEVADNSPTLAQPTITAEKAQAFIPFSIEVDQDYQGGLREELARLLADAKDTLEAEKYLSGAGHASFEPEGLLTGLSTTVRVQTAAATSFAVGDVYALRQAVPPRFKAAASVLASPDTFDTVYRMVGGGSSEPAPLPTREGPLLGSLKAEHSGMAVGTTANAKLAVAGDFTKFAIVDRIGLTIELVPHLFGANRRPTGQRGLYAYWRTGSGVLVENAFRYLAVKP